VAAVAAPEVTLEVQPDDPRLEEVLHRFAARRPLLVAIDFDGVLAPLVDDPAMSRPLPESSAALGRIADVDGVVVSYVSGRDLAGLTSVAQADERAHLVGSHGAEWQDDLQFAHRHAGLTETQTTLLGEVTNRLETIAAEHPGTRVEYKPSAAVLHTRLAAPEVGAQATQLAMEGPARLAGVKVTPGKDVVEIAVTSTTKGEAVSWMREHFAVEQVCYLGDDVTDETVFAVLGPDDLSIKVGPGETAARFRIGTPADVSLVLSRLADVLN
jgi:trehalose-phosphatase